jgi:ATP-dependent RNA helicase DHX34
LGKEETFKKPKLLSLQDEDFNLDNLDDNYNEDCQDIRHIDFKLMHNLNELQNKSLNCKQFTLREINLLKIIITCGLYPQIAISDEFNNYKRDSDQCFHSKYKAFVVLHPTSVFSYDPDILQPSEDGFLKNKQYFSSRHQLLVYVNLFETNKAYYMNNMRVPALQTLLLYARSLDTNNDCTRIIFDNWLEICLIDPHLAQKLVSATIYLRSSIEKLFEIRLQDHRMALDDQFDGDEDEDGSLKRKIKTTFHKERASNLERTLKKKLSEFLDSSVLYSLRRILPAQLTTLYKNNFTQIINQNELDSTLDKSAIKSNDLLKQLEDNFLKNSNSKGEVNSKGGFKITCYLNYNCLASDATIAITNEYSGTMKRHFKCNYCSKEFIFDLKERMIHEVECQQDDKSSIHNTNHDEQQQKKKKTGMENDYYCDVCKQNLNLTAIEILKHKKSHL